MTRPPTCASRASAPAAVLAGDTFNVDIVVSGITNEIITAWDIDVAFDDMLLSNSLVAFTSVPLMGGVADTFFDAFFDTGLTDAFALSLVSDAEIAALQCTPDCGPTFTLATLGFQALADGAPTIELVNWGLFNDIKGADNQQIFPTPEPASLALVGIALAGMLAPVALRRRRQAAAA